MDEVQLVVIMKMECLVIAVHANDTVLVCDCNSTYVFVRWTIARCLSVAFDTQQKAYSFETIDCVCDLCLQVVECPVEHRYVLMTVCCFV